MSPPRARPRRTSTCFPRVSGDEPPTETVTPETFEFSPRERG